MIEGYEKSKKQTVAPKLWRRVTRLYHITCSTNTIDTLTLTLTHSPEPPISQNGVELCAVLLFSQAAVCA